MRHAPTGEDAGGTRRWALVILLICLGWLAAMVVTSMLGYEHKTPVRIENWHPDTSSR